MTGWKLICNVLIFPSAFDVFIGTQDFCAHTVAGTAFSKASFINPGIAGMNWTGTLICLIEGFDEIVNVEYKSERHCHAPERQFLG